MADSTLVSTTLLGWGKASTHQGMMGQQQPMRGQHCLDWLQGRQMHFGHARSEHLNFPTFIFWHPITQIIGHMLILVKAYIALLQQLHRSGDCIGSAQWSNLCQNVSHYSDTTLVLERTPKYRTSNTLNIKCLNINPPEHHIELRTS